MRDLEVVEICAGAGGQALGLELAGFHHRLAVELDPNAANTLRHNRDKNPKRAGWDIRTGDVADPEVWKPSEYEGVDLLAGGVPCPPFSIAGKQLGANDERDLFAWAVEQCAVVRPKALLLENVRGLSMPRFTGYRQHVLDRLRELGYIAEWRLLHAKNFGVPQLRPRFVLVALQEEYVPFFRWTEFTEEAPTVGNTLLKLMSARGWKGAQDWAAKAQGIAPTIVGGSKKHGGADLGPTRAKKAWQALAVDAHGVADEAPDEDASFDIGPKLTCAMVARIQGWQDRWGWEFTGRKTSMYRQIGNAFPPPVAKAVGDSIRRALRKEGEFREVMPDRTVDRIYQLLRETDDFIAMPELIERSEMQSAEIEHRISLLERDFVIDIDETAPEPRYKMGSFKAFLGQEDHDRHERFLRARAQIS
ncbi:Modification methylase AplI [Actinomadura rubteroloni]|uniref:Cytosine-specific methyltransferase n=1 Tax=Actinomadura rubteroloni TaxID=1926885 RepID=A0A2P4UNQ4_9ACTN|nr:DNA (cytosine-5-)-methyltransferase [Actinomadura rubteroloni]POM26677.1 Modification methylase AplI [Actinomadura rubteroloni]